ncbi:MAG: CaiB/BaiF CoA transferase family protein [Betaproteobacteria bacterium]
MNAKSKALAAEPSPKAMLTQASRPKPLDDIVVIDFSSLLPGPMCSLLLAEAGAKVIKIERPGLGDEMRGYQPAAGGDSANFILLNRGKTSISLDLKSANDRQTALSLIEKADVLIEQFRPGVMERLGLSYEIAQALNPGIIYCSISGYGQSGPARDLAAHDLNYMARSGLLSLSGDEHGQPGLPCALIAEYCRWRLPSDDEYFACAPAAIQNRSWCMARHRDGRKPASHVVLGAR